MLSKRLLHVFGDIIESSESKFTLESDRVEDLVTKNRNLLTVESQRKTCAAK